MVRSVQYFKDLFQVGYKITKTDYDDWLDSFLHATTGISVANITDLSATLANYRLKSVHIPAAEIDGLSDAINAVTQNFLTSSSSISQTQVTGLIDTLAQFTTVEQVQEMIDEAIANIENAQAPSIGANGNWYIGDTDTGVRAAGQDGVDGVSPHIGANGNWYIGDTDTGVPANPVIDSSNAETIVGFVVDDWVTAYNNEIGGARDGVNRIFTAPHSFYPNTFTLGVSGIWMCKGDDADFQIISQNQIQTTVAPKIGNTMIMQYIKAHPSS